ncbi:MAG: MFS transporter, partial [Bifidobacterium tibiigranuli]|nr:MFS transporter [Bifidobacterium tibiigranuli]
SNTLWMAVGFNTSSAFTISVITSIVNIATTIVAILLVDRIGRKLLLMIGSVGMTISLAVLAVCFGTAAMVPDATGQLAPVLNGASGPIALVSANVFVIAFGMSWGPVIWVLLGEMFPNRIRGAALSLAAAGQWVANWIVTVTFPGLKDISLGLAYGIYTGFALISLLFVAKFLTETKGRTLEDMDDALGEDRPAASDVAQAS